MSNRNINRIVVSAVLLLALLCACAFAEGEPALRFESDEISMAVKKTEKVSPLAENVENAKTLKYTWVSADEQIATVQNGTVKGIAPGETTVTCTTELPEGKQLSASLKVRVVEPVKTLKIETKTNTPVNVGEKLAIEYTIQPENATDKSLTWESSDPAIATVDNAGVVTAVAPGKVTISAATNDGSKKQAKVGLYIPSLRCETSEITVDKPEGATFTLDYYGDDWDNNVTVKADGNFYEYTAERDGNKVSFWISAGSAGKGKLTVKDKKDPQATVTVPVIATESGIALGSVVSIEKVVLKGDKMEVTVKNNGSESIDRVRIVFIPRNKAGEVLFMSAPSPTETETNCINFYSVKPGKTARDTWNIQAVFPGSTQVDMAVLFFDLADNTTIWFTEKGFRWFSASEQKYITCPEDRNINVYPDSMTMEKSDSITLGIQCRFDLSWVTEHFGYHHIGLVVRKVTEDSLAAKAGLQANDLIVAVNGLTYEENPQTYNIGRAEMADTGKMTLTVERYGEEGTFEVELTKE